MMAETAVLPEKIIKAGEHLIGKFVGTGARARGGATLVAVGSLHGNEPSGAAALRRVARKLENMGRNLRGRVYLLAGNTRALEKGARFIDADLNRHWSAENNEKNKLAGSLKIAEDREQHELLNIFEEILLAARGEVFVLDLHSTSAEGLPFATVGDTLRNRHFAQKFPVTILLGIEEQLDGTMLEYLNNVGAVTLGFEAGQHDSPLSVDNHEALVWLALVNAGLLGPEDVPDFENYRRGLAAATGNRRILEVRHRHAITPADSFAMNPGFENFQKIRRGQILARDKKGDVRAAESGLVLMPLYQKQGEDGFFIGRPVARFWIWLSEVLRNLRVARFMRFLPGVRSSPAGEESLIVDTGVARFFPLQIFHLLGFRRLRWRGRELIVSRRPHDTKSPFAGRE